MVGQLIINFKNMKYWEKLLLSQRIKGKDGLTIPFLIGSQNFLNTDEKDNIEKLFINILMNGSFEITLRFCINIQTLILEKRKPQNAIYFPKFNHNEQSKFSVAIGLKNELWNNVENIIIELENQFQSKIEQNKFSAQSNLYERTAQWGKFSDSEDIPFIKESFQKERDDFLV